LEGGLGAGFVGSNQGKRGPVEIGVAAGSQCGGFEVPISFAASSS
jgi:hypothetical protein